MTKGPGERIPDELIDAFFDGELDDRAVNDLFGQLPADPARYEQVAKTQRMISLLGDQEQGPDLTGDILREVDRRRGFLSAPLRRFVRVGRLTAAAVLLLAFLGIASAQRYSPDTFRVKAEPRPVALVVDRSCSAAARSCEQLAALPGGVREALSPIAREMNRVTLDVECQIDARDCRHQKEHCVTAELEISTLASAPSFSAGSRADSRGLRVTIGGWNGQHTAHVVFFDGEPQIMPVGFVASIGSDTVAFSPPEAREDPFGLSDTDGLIHRTDFRYFRPWHVNQNDHTQRP